MRLQSTVCCCMRLDTTTTIAVSRTISWGNGGPSRVRILISAEYGSPTDTVSDRDGAGRRGYSCTSGGAALGSSLTHPDHGTQQPQPGQLIVRALVGALLALWWPCVHDRRDVLRLDRTLEVVLGDHEQRRVGLRRCACLFPGFHHSRHTMRSARCRTMRARTVEVSPCRCPMSSRSTGPRLTCCRRRSTRQPANPAGLRNRWCAPFRPS